MDVSYINICGTFYYLCIVIDGYSRYLVHWDIRESMKEAAREERKQRRQAARVGAENGLTARSRVV